MTVTESAISICNSSQVLLGQQMLTSINPGTTNIERAYETQYDRIRRTCLRELPWQFARARTIIQRTRTPEFDFSDAYGLPSDGIRMLSFGGPIQQSPGSPPPGPPGLANRRITYYDIEDNPKGGKEILCNNQGNQTLALRYIRDITDVNKFDPCFLNIFTIKLALYVSYYVTKNKEDVSRMNDLLKIEMPMAYSINGQENPPTRIQESAFINARMRGTVGNDAIAPPWTVFDSTSWGGSW